MKKAEYDHKYERYVFLKSLNVSNSIVFVYSLIEFKRNGVLVEVCSSTNEGSWS